MNNGWSEHHRKVHMKQIDQLQRKLDEIKATVRAEKTFKRIVDRLESAGHPAVRDDAQAVRDEGVPAPGTEEHIGGA